MRPPARSGCSSAGWHVDQAIAFTKQQDVVHRVVGPPGIVLVGEGNPGRLKALLATERRKPRARGHRDPDPRDRRRQRRGPDPAAQADRARQKMKRQVKPAEITDILARLKAIDAYRPHVPMPKGPVPTSMKGIRGNMRGR